MSNQKKNEISKNQNIFIALALVSLLLVLPFASALSIGGIFNSIGKAISNAVTAVVNFVKNVIVTPVVNVAKSVATFVTGGGGGGGGTSSGNTLGGGNTGTGNTYNPQGEGTLSAPVVVQGTSYTQSAVTGGALYHDVDLGNIKFECINCPVDKGNVAGFDYLLSLEMFNKGNTMAQDVDLYVSITYPDGEKKDYSFKNTRLSVNSGSYTFRFTVPNVGIDSSTKTLKTWALTKGTKQTADIQLYAQVTNDHGVDRKEIRYKVTPQQSCSWDFSNVFSPRYVCKELPPLTSTYEVDYTITDSPSENEAKATIQINTLSPDLYASGIFSRFT